MISLKCLVTASMLAAPVLFASVSAEARTARQDALQGQGIYTTSKGIPEGYSGGGYYPRPRGYGYRGGYGYRSYRRHRRHYDGY